MVSQYFEDQRIIQTLKRLKESCDYIIEWNENISDPEDFPASSSGMQTLAASCMLIEAIGEGIKNIDKLNPQYLELQAPDIPWRDYVGMRSRIAHGYHELDVEIVFDIVKNNIPELKSAIELLLK